MVGFRLAKNLELWLVQSLGLVKSESTGFARSERSSFVRLKSSGAVCSGTGGFTDIQALNTSQIVISGSGQFGLPYSVHSRYLPPTYSLVTV